MKPDRLAEFGKLAADVLDAAKAVIASRKGGVSWTDADPMELSAVASMIFAQVLADRAREAAEAAAWATPPAATGYYVIGCHVPGETAYRSIAGSGTGIDAIIAPFPDVRLFPLDGVRTVPAGALPVALIVPPGRWPDVAKTFPGVQP